MENIDTVMRQEIANDMETKKCKPKKMEFYTHKSKEVA
jgi:hypothetical protein